MLALPKTASRHYVVVGLGRSGYATCLALQQAGAFVSAWDDELVNRQDAMTQGIPIMAPESVCWSYVTALILSPGIPHELPRPHDAAQWARNAHVPIICDIELLAQNYIQARFVGITGTNGKSTTTALVHFILQSADLETAMGGNIGIPVCALPSLSSTGTYVLELSSYQLERAPSLSVDVAVLLNITPDHLSRHGTMERYRAAKKHIFNHTKDRQYAVVNADESTCVPILKTLQQSPRHQVVPVSLQHKLAKGIYVANGWLMDSFFQDDQRIFDLTPFINLPGRHNQQNILCAYAVACIYGLNPQQIQRYIMQFKNLPHRLERIGTLNGVDFVNDSKATNPESTAHALAAYDTIYWICGGMAKESELDGLEFYYQRVCHAYTIGHSTARFTEILNQHHVAVTPCYTLEQAVQRAFDDAQHNSKGIRPVVLLSPACASFDQYKDFEARGEHFRALFMTLQQEVEHR